MIALGPLAACSNASDDLGGTVRVVPAALERGDVRHDVAATRPTFKPLPQLATVVAAGRSSAMGAAMHVHGTFNDTPLPPELAHLRGLGARTVATPEATAPDEENGS